MKFGVVNKSTILNRFVLHILQRNITHLAVITRKTNIKLGILKGGTGKEPETVKDKENNNETHNLEICLGKWKIADNFVSKGTR